MPSPFPGMDPYPEGPIWNSFHFALCGEIVRQLAPRLRPRYLALGNERQVLSIFETWPDDSASRRDVYPDVAVSRVEPTATSAPGPSASTSAVIAAAPLEVTTLLPTPVPHVTVEIRDVAERRLVTSIEVLSPTNKRGDGRVEYLEKRNRILVSRSHLREIDLLRQGQRVPTREPLPTAPYFVFLSRAERRPVTEVWPVALEQPLPTVPVPLLPGDPDVPLDLQATFAQVYDGVGYDLAVDYSRPSQVPLSPEQAVWAEQRLRAARGGR